MKKFLFAVFLLVAAVGVFALSDCSQFQEILDQIQEKVQEQMPTPAPDNSGEF